MSVRTVGLVTTGAAGDAGRIAAAADLARRLGAQVDCVALAVEPVAVDAYSIGSVALITRGRDEAAAEAGAVAAAARAALAATGVPGEVEPVVLPSLALTADLARRLRFCDLVVAGRSARGDALTPSVAEAALFGAGVPLLVLPDAAPDLGRPFGRVVLAWNDGDEALRAARAALPLLAEAEAVDVALVDPPAHAPGRADPGGDLAQWLSRQGVRCEIHVLARTEPTVAGVLARFARERGAELVVMGAYGHSRLREAVLGGTTRDLMADAPLPLLLAR